MTRNGQSRAKAKPLGMGVDFLVVLLLYALGVAGLFAMPRPSRRGRSLPQREHPGTGLRYQVSDALTLGVELGAGIGRDSPRFRGIFSLQVGFDGR